MKKLSSSLIERAKGDKKKKKKPTSQIQLVELQKPQVYELVEESDGHGHQHGGGHVGGHGGGHQHGGGGHQHGGIGGHGGGHGIKMKKKHGRSIGGWFSGGCTHPLYSLALVLIFIKQQII